MKSTLTLGSGQRSQETTIKGTVTGSVYVYTVNGLPTDHEAWIADFKTGWKILRVLNGKQGDWTGEYTSAENALSSLQEEFNSSSA